MDSELTVITQEQDLEVIKDNSLKATAAKKANQAIISKATAKKIRKHHYTVIQVCTSLRIACMILVSSKCTSHIVLKCFTGLEVKEAS